MRLGYDGSLVFEKEFERNVLLDALAAYMLTFPEHDSSVFDLMFKIAKVDIRGASQEVG